MTMGTSINILLTIILIGVLIAAALWLKNKFSNSRKKELLIDKTPTSILAIERIAELTTASFFDEKVVHAGFDFRDFRSEDLHEENGILHLRLPKVKVFSPISNPNDWIYFSTDKLSYEQSLVVEEQAEEQFVKEAIDNGILTSAENYGRERLKMIFLSLGYKDVVFED